MILGSNFAAFGAVSVANPLANPFSKPLTNPGRPKTNRTKKFMFMCLSLRIF